MNSTSEVDTVGRFSSKAATYDRARWEYDTQAIATVVEVCGLTRASALADIGAGPGTVARRFVDSVGAIYAVEPNAEMRREARLALAAYPHVTLVAGRAEATTLPDASVDVIIAGRALHWFDPVPARAEFRRILRPGGWLAVLRNEWTDAELRQATQALRVPELGWRMEFEKSRFASGAPDDYFGHASFAAYAFPATTSETWQAFLARLSSFSPAPDANHPLRSRFVAAARAIFDAYSSDGLLHIHHATTLLLGRMQ